MFRSSFLLLAALLPGTAFAGSGPKLPPHGWVRGDFDVATVTPKITVGGAFALSRVTALTLEASATDGWVGANLGASVEIGALYLNLGAGPEVGWSGDGGFAADVRAVLEVPPLPIYWETWLRPTLRTPFGGAADTLVERNLLLWTFAAPIAAGFAHDGLHALSEGAPTSNRWGLAANIRLARPATLGLIVGYEADAAARARVEAGPDWLAAQATLTVAF